MPYLRYIPTGEIYASHRHIEGRPDMVPVSDEEACRILGLPYTPPAVEAEAEAEVVEKPVKGKTKNKAAEPAASDNMQDVDY